MNILIMNEFCRGDGSLDWEKLIQNNAQDSLKI